jgi:hypothetical protein
VSLRPKISAEERENTFVIYDCTGEFSGDNKGGYGGPNPLMSSVTAAKLEIEPPLSKTAYPVTLNMFGILPNKDGIGVEIYPSQLNLSVNYIPSGKYKFRYTITVTGKGGVPQTITCYLVEVFVNAVTCCIDALQPKLTENPFKDPRQVKIVELSNLLENANWLIDSGKYDKAESVIEYLNTQCQCQNC